MGVEGVEGLALCGFVVLCFRTARFIYNPVKITSKNVNNYSRFGDCLTCVKSAY